MLPCSSSAQMEGCEEERDAHMQTEVKIKQSMTENRFILHVGRANVCKICIRAISSASDGTLLHRLIPAAVIRRPASPGGYCRHKRADPSLNLSPLAI